jgi:hypothetical protein
MNCKVGGCEQTVPITLLDSGLCLEHFLDDVVDRTRSFARQLAESNLDETLREAVLQFIIFSAARLATIGTYSPPDEQLARGRLLNAMLVLADLRDKLDKATGGAIPH